MFLTAAELAERSDAELRARQDVEDRQKREHQERVDRKTQQAADAERWNAALGILVDQHINHRMVLSGLSRPSNDDSAHLAARCRRNRAFMAVRRALLAPPM